MASKEKPHKSGDNGDDKLIVVPYRPMRKLWLLLIMLLGYGAVALAAYVGGQIVAIRHGNVPFNHGMVEDVQIRKLENEIERLHEQIAIQEQNVLLEKGAMEIMRKENLNLQDTISRLEERVAYYERVIHPDSKEKGLLIDQLNLMPLEADREYEFTFNLVQVAGGEKVSGYADVKVFGIESGESKSYKLQDLADGVGAKGIRVGFRNFQSLKGKLVLPAGFEPNKIEVYADFSGGKKVKLRKSYDWREKESGLDVEKK